LPSRELAPPRARHKVKKNRNWTNVELRSAIVDVDKGVPIRIASRNHKISAILLRGHLYRSIIQRRRGKMGVLTEKDEEEVVEYLLKMQTLGFPLPIS